MQTYFIKVALRGISPMIWRRLQIPGKTSLAQLHHILQATFQWDNDHLHQFHIYGKDYGIAYEGGVIFSDNPHKVLIEDFEFDEGDKFTYEYNFFAHWLVDIRIEKINTTKTNSQPKCIKGKGLHGLTPYDSITAELDLLQALATSDEATTFGDILPEIKAYQSSLFSTKRTNQAIQEELTELQLWHKADCK